MDGPLFERAALQRARRISPELAVVARPEGLFVPALELFLDPQKPVPRSFVSHAHGDHIVAGDAMDRESTAPPALRIASVETDRLLRARQGTSDVTHPLGWREPLEIAGCRVHIVPAGHILGAAALVVESAHGTLVYTGDTKPERGLTHPPAELPRCDVLVIESTFGLPIFRFPDDGANHEALVRFAAETLAMGKTPVFLAHALGKGQEIAQCLGSQGIATRAHGSMTRINEVYRSFGVPLALVRPYDRDDREPAALIIPPRDRFGGILKRRPAGEIRVAYVSGWALLDASRERFDADVTIPLSDHASFAGLEVTVDACKPARVFVTHGFANSYARHLRTRGIAAEPLDAAGFEA